MRRRSRMTRGTTVVIVPMLAVQTALGVGCARAEVTPVASGPVAIDFNGPAGSPPDPGLWTIDAGPSAEHGWERGSLQTYTNSPENVRLDGSGNLVLEARRSGAEAGGAYTSGRIVTRGNLAFGFGTIVARIKFPSGHGIWPAFWLLGSSIDDVGWPWCGEIDVMELIGDAAKYHVALHAPNADINRTGPIADLSGGFHNYWVTRKPGSITIGVDQQALAWFDPASLPRDSQWVFDGPVFLLLNVAVGGDWPGPPDTSTPFPAAMTVDWISFRPSDEG